MSFHKTQTRSNTYTTCPTCKRGTIRLVHLPLLLLVILRFNIPVCAKCCFIQIAVFVSCVLLICHVTRHRCALCVNNVTHTLHIHTTFSSHTCTLASCRPPLPTISGHHSLRARNRHSTTAFRLCGLPVSPVARVPGMIRSPIVRTRCTCRSLAPTSPIGCC